MKIGALTFLQRMHDNYGQKSRTLIIAAWHWKWSVTWSFILSYDHANKHKDKYGSRFKAWRVHRQKGFYFHAGLRLPFCGLISLQTQPTLRA